MPQSCHSTHARHAQALPALLAGALMSVWLMFGLVDEADAQTAAPVQVAVAPNISISEPGGSGLNALDATLEDRLQTLAMAGARQVAPNQARVEIEIGKLDPRLRLAPCAQIQPYLPPGTRMWGRSRLGLRCVAGVTKWNVTLPLTIKVYGQAFVAAADLPTGTILTQEHFRLAEVDIAGESGAIYTQSEAWLGRHLAKPVAAGQALRSVDLKLRQWVQPGDRVQVMATGDGYAIAGEGQAMGVGLEGQDVRVRFDNGRMATGRTIGERRVEVVL
ncbi:flagellar basal body P-ring formation chaperone FlgA [Mitsuaria sp. 7]|uniref:flagellar basal body P-ring formation chaperone FlgA n=1 Tax=Mitsuaria sp. 7 TaxID=1658665 RepID=UPI00082BB116|nr:flagellar basal body P-ring formation chaperone FlgA [Mitsuaria sp. 7]